MDLAELISAKAFLGDEFLTWLWWRDARHEGAFTLGDGTGIRVHIGEHLELETLTTDGPRGAFRGGSPGEAPEARVALKQGKRVTKARLLIYRGQQEFEATVTGRTLDLSTIKIPDVLTKVQDEKFYDRIGLVEDLDGMLRDLYGQFVDLRVSANWAKELKEIQAWVAAGIQGAGS
jgi:hypothetical protein